MKTKAVILILLSFLLASCAPKAPTQESHVDVVEVATESPATKAPMTQEPVATKEPISTEVPTEVSTETPMACVTLITPVNGVEIPSVGKVTFSWTPMDEAGKYVLNIILPSGDIVPFETDQTFYDRYMEAFVAGGEYQWEVVAQNTDGSEICVSEVATFDKPAYKNPNGDGNDSNDGSDGSGGDGGTTDDGDGPGDEG